MIVLVTEMNLTQAAAVHSAAWKESHRAFCTPEFVELHTPERQMKYLQSKMDGGTKLFLLLEDEPVGIVSVTDSLIEDLYVLPEKQNRRKYESNTEITNAPVSEANQAEQEVVGSGVAEVSTRNLYFILQSDPPGECALFISIIQDDTTVVLQKGMKWEEIEVA